MLWSGGGLVSYLAINVMEDNLPMDCHVHIDIAQINSLTLWPIEKDFSPAYKKDLSPAYTEGFLTSLYKKNLSTVYTQPKCKNCQKPIEKVFSPVYAEGFLISLYKKKLSTVYSQSK